MNRLLSILVIAAVFLAMSQAQDRPPGTLPPGAGKPDGYMACKADGAGYPMTIDLTPDRGPAKGKALKGIYALDGNSLKICYVSPATEEPEKAERPKKMGAEGTVTVVFGRIPP